MPPVRGTISLDFQIAADATAPAAARRCVEGLEQHADSDLVGDIKFLVNELVTNAIQHGCQPGEWIGLSLAGDPACVRVEVSDPGPGFDGTLRPPRLEDTSGRGLFLVSRLADGWGVTRDDRTRVWFEIHPAKMSSMA